MPNRCAASETAHPRVGGENEALGFAINQQMGSSPRGRGKRPDRIAWRLGRGLIPAWAGKTQRAVPDEHARPGSSPRGRGKRACAPTSACEPRLIPAWAGKTYLAALSPPKKGAHPRVGGENSRVAWASMRRTGSSPRGRGKRFALPGLLAQRRLIPAWAGKTMTCSMMLMMTGAHPRVGGENSRAAAHSAGTDGSSPRGRGKLHSAHFVRSMVGLIPAWAGKTSWI